LPDFSRYNIPKWGEIYQIGRVARFFCYNLPKWGKYTDLPGNILNVNIIWQMAVKYTNIFLCKILQKLPKFGIFWFENIPSGNTVGDTSPEKITVRSFSSTLGGF
jgi:hypothetical protein